jgi:hypothetical protein
MNTPRELFIMVKVDKDAAKGALVDAHHVRFTPEMIEAIIREILAANRNKVSAQGIGKKRSR